MQDEFSPTLPDWTQLTGTVPVSRSGTLAGALFYVETAAGADNIYIDDANLHR